jgi:pimeloyl-ACP methyl ester carboxylesterase
LQNENKFPRTKIFLVIALVMILLGGLLASLTQTNWGKVDVRDIRFVGTNGIVMSGLLYVPDGVTNKTPAPGILAIHGYINSRETQDGFAIEFARRGYVVLALDESGHGFSDPPTFANAFGGTDGFKYLTSLDIVDKNNIGLEGHSMGGWAVVIAAAYNPTGYKSIVLEGSATGVFGAPAGTATSPRNLCVVLSKWDEFSNLMWGSTDPKTGLSLDPSDMNVPANIVDSVRLKAQFGTTDTVVVDKLYGSMSSGTARILYMPAVTHPGDHISRVAIGHAIDWFQRTLIGGKAIPSSNQIWYWKEIGTLIALIGMVLLLFPVGSLLLRKCEFFKELEGAPAPPKSATGIGWWIGALIFAAVPALTYFTFKQYFVTWKMAANKLFPENISTQLLIWVLLVGAISLVLFLLWHFVFNRKAKASASDYGLSWGTGVKGVGWKKIGKSFLLAATVAFIAYLTLAFSDWFFKTDFRFWVFAIKPMSVLHFRIFLCYLIPFTAFFVVLALALHGQLRPRGKKGAEISRAAEMWINFAMLVIGFVVLLLIQYIPLLSGGHLMFVNENLFSIIAFQLLPIFTIVALVNTFFYRKTGHIYAGAFLNAILITWIVVASQAIHFNIIS